jgi:hypothetical protein
MSGRAIMSARITAWLFGAVLALVVTAAAGEEDINSANYIMPSCRVFVDRKPGGAFEQGHCSGIIEGILLIARVR